MKKTNTTRNRRCASLVVAMLALGASLLGGCASYTQSKVDLTDQAIEGITRVQAALIDRDEAAREAATAWRDRLNAAFDADATQREPLTAEWVIEHRKAYAAAIDAFDTSQRASAKRFQTAIVDSLDAIRLLLTQLQQMHTTELKLTLPEVIR